MIEIKLAQENDFRKIWVFLSEIISEGKTYSYPMNMTKEEAKITWMELPRETYIAVDDNEIIGSYYLKTNQLGSGKHVCNCGYIVSPLARGKGVATKMCLHSQNRAIELAYKAMQYNFVISTNTIAVNLWQKLGYEIVGRLKKACLHPEKGYVDALVMYKWFENSD